MRTRFVLPPSVLSLLRAAAGPGVADEPAPLADDAAELEADLPTDIAAAEAATYMDAGSNRNIVGWGWNYRGQATAPAGNDHMAIAAGGWHGLALKTDGSIVGWGWNDRGQATAPAGNDHVAIAAGDHHGLALAVDPPSP